jgi:endonuclease/exonuclease/phosphatase family metal-dependent hydrolase
LRPFNQEAEQDSELCIVYKSKYNLINEGFKSFSSIKKTPVLGFKHPSFGMLWADFEIDGKTTRFVTTHLHAGINPKARIAEVRLAKKILLAESPVWRTILAGDFNTGFPGEQTQMTHALAPEFIWSTKEIGPTLNSRYSEKTANLPNRIATLLNKFNIGIQLQTDHVFVNQQTKKDNHIECSKLSDRVSDHSPVEFIINTIT